MGVTCFFRPLLHEILPGLSRIYSLFIIIVPPSIISPPMNATVAFGESVNFTCTASAQPLPTISWWHVDDINGTRIQINTTISSYNVFEVVIEERQVVSTLTILEAELGDGGEYVCIAELVPLFPSVEESAILTVGEIVVFCVILSCQFLMYSIFQSMFQNFSSLQTLLWRLTTVPALSSRV